jgi:hypothetical protein
VWEVPSLAQEWVLATKGLRTCATFGTWRGFRLLKPDATTMVQDWKPVALLTRTIAEASRGSQAAIDMLTHLQEALQFNPHKPRRSPSTEKT